MSKHGFKRGSKNCDCPVCVAYNRGYDAGYYSAARSPARKSEGRPSRPSQEHDFTYGGLL